MVWFDGCRVAYGMADGMSRGTSRSPIWVNLCGGEKHKLSQHLLPSLKAAQTMPAWGGCP